MRTTGRHHVHYRVESWHGVFGWSSGMEPWSEILLYIFWSFIETPPCFNSTAIKFICLCNQFDDTFNAKIRFYDFLFWICCHIFKLIYFYHNYKIQILFKLSYTIYQRLICYHHFLMFFVYNQLYRYIVTI